MLRKVLQQCASTATRHDVQRVQFRCASICSANESKHVIWVACLALFIQSSTLWNCLVRVSESGLPSTYCHCLFLPQRCIESAISELRTRGNSMGTGAVGMLRPHSGAAGLGTAHLYGGLGR